MLLDPAKNPWLNLGCGSKIHRDWINIDFDPSLKDVWKHNLLKKLPFDDNSIKYIYNSHLLEHFPESDGIRFLKECFRLLQKGGIVRIVLPDLENIINTYVDLIKNKDQFGKAEFSRLHHWLIIELFDQLIREYPGGMMKENIMIKDPVLSDFISKRIGNIITVENQSVSHKRPLSFRIKRKLIKTLLTKDEYKAYNIGLFRNSGEIHKWMYDKYSLSELLFETGFSVVEIKDPYLSNIPDWEKYLLDVRDNEVLQPNSLYVEAIK